MPHPLIRPLLSLLLTGTLSLGASMAHADTFSTLKEGLMAYMKGEHSTVIKTLAPLAKTGNTTAQYLTASSQLNAKPPLRDLAAGEATLLKLAAQGHVGAMRDLGKINTFVKSPTNLPEAQKWLTEAAERGNDDAQNMLGVMLLSSDGGIKVDAVQAYKWLLLAAERGHVVSGLMLESDKFTPEHKAQGAALAKDWKPIR
ncbi:MAG: tetratricopeptide repeat protein [Leptothrix ochracea]|uniref:tetratricopeptide repeat protein n=1 Tax=Leptothrix ochracea TaxID=735331 RepID=UPI0034E29400